MGGRLLLSAGLSAAIFGHNRIKMKPGERPILDVPYSTQDLALEAVALVGFLLTIGLTVLFWSALPPLVPTHFGVTGEVDAWGDKRTILILPSVSLILYLMFTFACRYPHRFNYPWPITAQNARQQYRLACSLLAWFKAEVILLFSFMEWTTIRTALGQVKGLGVAFIPVVLLIMFGTLGGYFYFAYRNR